MSTATENKTEGKTDEIKGKAKQAWGDLTDDDEMKAKGESDELKGRGKQAVGHVQDAVNDLRPD